MKRIATLLVALCSVSTFALAGLPEDVNLAVGKIKVDNAGTSAPRTPMQPPKASIDEYTFYIQSAHPDYTLQVVEYDASGNETVVYTTFLSAGVNTVILPATLSGDYEIRLIFGNWYFWGEINL